MSAPLLLAYLGNGRFAAEGPRMLLACDSLFEPGRAYRLVPMDEREKVSHQTRAHYFAVLREVWETLPHGFGDRFPTSEHLRKWALIQTGFHKREEFACPTPGEAKRLATIIKAIDEYAVVILQDAVVVRLTAKSQSNEHMDRGEFQRSKEAVLDYLATLIETNRETLAEQTRSHA